MRIGIRNATFLCTALALAFFLSSLHAHAAVPAMAHVSTSAAGAKHVTLTVSFRTELRCGLLMGSRTLVLGLPAKERVPATVPGAAVKVGGRAASKVSMSGHAVTITLAPPRGMMCDSVRIGVARIVVAGAAGIGNPRSPGTYSVKVTHGSETFAAPLAIH
jgi:hypothetical protein